MTHEEQTTMLKVKSLLNHLSYFIKPEDVHIYNDFHKLCREHCAFYLKDDVED